MNDKKLTASRGITNLFEIQILNSDRKPVDLTDKTVRFTFSKIKANNIYLDRELEVVNAVKGIYRATITEADMVEIPPGLAQLAFYIEDEGSRTPLFKNISGGYAIDVDVINGPYAIPETDIADDYGTLSQYNVTVEDYGSVADNIEITETQQ